jgi:hypothetical protein
LFLHPSSPSVISVPPSSPQPRMSPTSEGSRGVVLILQPRIHDCVSHQFLHPPRSCRCQYVSCLTRMQVQADSPTVDTLLPAAWTSSDPSRVGLWTQRMYVKPECVVGYTDRQGCGHVSLHDSDVCPLVECRGYPAQARTG